VAAPEVYWQRFRSATLPRALGSLPLISCPELQFDWVATPGMYGLQAPTGGFFSLQFDAPNRGWYESEGPASLDGFYDLTTGQFITFNQDSGASIFLQASHSDPFSAAGHLRRRNYIKTITIYPPNATTASFAISTRPMNVDTPVWIAVRNGGAQKNDKVDGDHPRSRAEPSRRRITPS
jgi:hypothetical protein